MSQIISKISIKNSSGTYDTRDIGAKGQNVKVGYDASGKVIPDVDSQTPTTTKQLTKVLQDAEENISNLNKNKAPDNHAWSDADSGVNHGLADGTHYGHIKVGDGLTVNSGKVDVAYGNSDNTACEGNDARLSDARKNPKAVTFSDGTTDTSYDGSSEKTVTAATIGAAPSGHTTVNATSSILGHVKVGTGITNNSGTISVSYGSVAGTACQGNDSRLSDARPASDVYSWAKASSKPDYAWNEITDKPSTFTPSSHTHNYLPLSGGTLTDELVIDTGNEEKGIYFVNPSDKSKGTRVSYVNGSPFVQGAWNAAVLKENGTLLSNKYAEYEEGTWTPTNVPGSSDIDTSVYEFKYSKYIKIGNIVILTTNATPTNYETKSAELMININSFPFLYNHIALVFAINASGDSSIGTWKPASGSIFNFGTYTFTGVSSGLTNVGLTIIYSERK